MKLKIGATGSGCIVGKRRGDWECKRRRDLFMVRMCYITCNNMNRILKNENFLKKKQVGKERKINYCYRSGKDLGRERGVLWKSDVF